MEAKLTALIQTGFFFPVCSSQTTHYYTWCTMDLNVVNKIYGTRSKKILCVRFPLPDSMRNLSFLFPMCRHLNKNGKRGLLHACLDIVLMSTSVWSCEMSIWGPCLKMGGCHITATAMTKELKGLIYEERLNNLIEWPNLDPTPCTKVGGKFCEQKISRTAWHGRGRETSYLAVILCKGHWLGQQGSPDFTYIAFVRVIRGGSFQTSVTTLEWCLKWTKTSRELHEQGEYKGMTY